MVVQTARFSIEEYHQIVASGALGSRCIELLDGELIEVSPEPPYHANRNNRLFKYFLTQFDGLADVRSAHPITLMNSEPQPDIALARLP
ncbi:MAG: Uma2 family endonuclease, partial [Cyanobacteria bacterium P01_A01_bin.135]